MGTKHIGGVMAAGTERLGCVERVSHPNFGVWYDPGNVSRCTGLGPVAELEPLLPHVLAFTAKDCAAKGGEVMIQLGAGAVDFAALFRRLRRAGFTGPVMLEGGAVGESADAITRTARANREFLERALVPA